MKAFIEKEAQEKAKEIRMKADEEYEIEKASIVMSETTAIDSAYEQKLKKASLAQQIVKSTIANKTRLRILATKEEVLGDVFDEAQKEIKKAISKKGEYKKVLTGLIEEGLSALLEDTVSLVVREQDVLLAKEASEDAAKAFEKKVGFPVTITVSEEKYLNKDSLGGVIVTNSTGKIDVSNTFEERLNLLSQEALPAIRLELFGPSKTRKFFD